MNILSAFFYLDNHVYIAWLSLLVPYKTPKNPYSGYTELIIEKGPIILKYATISSFDEISIFYPPRFLLGYAHDPARCISSKYLK